MEQALTSLRYNIDLETIRAMSLAVAKRLAMGALTLVIIIYLVYFGLDMAGGTEFQTAVVQAVEKTLTYISNLLHGELGMTAPYSVSYLPVPVGEVLPQILQRSFGLLLASLGIAALLGIAFGIWAAKRRGTQWPLFMLLITTLGISLPSFFLALLFQMGVIWLTKTSGRVVLPVGGFGWDEHILLPALVLSLRPFAQIARITHISLTEIFAQDHVRTARSKGLTSRMVLDRHVLKNALVPILTTVGLSLRFSLSSLPIVEFFFGWQGTGFTLLKTIAIRDDNLTIAMLLSLATFFILINLILDLSYRFIDPRLRTLESSISQESRQRIHERLRELFASLWRGLRDFSGIRWGRARQSSDESSPYASILESHGEEIDARGLYDGRAGVRRSWIRATLGNPPLLLGGFIVLCLAFVVLFGSQISPHSPYTTQGLVFEEGEFSVPPFEPGEEYPWGTDVLGRDIMSLVLSGAQQTFILASLAFLARLIVGFVLGALAGWWQGSWLDRLIMGTVEVISTFPTLLLAMTLILALDIRSGMIPFIIALCFVGWSETMQFVRGEIMRIRPQLYIESARALGIPSGRIIFRHVLPNVIVALVSIAVLEMGSVLILLGELGFIGIFIGGGIYAELQWSGPLYHYSDVPEWGALLSNVRTYAQSYPWTAIYPSLAFFVAIFGINLFGEGIRLMVDKIGVRVLNLFNRYSVSAGLALIGIVMVLRGSTGAIATYARQASAFDGQEAYSFIKDLSDPIFEGRALGSKGMDLSAVYIARQFEDLGLQAAGEKFSYFQLRKREFLQLTGVPSLTIEDGGQVPVYLKDFNVYWGENRPNGESKSEVKFVALGEAISYQRYGNQYFAIRDRMDYSGEILLTFPEDMFHLEHIRRAGTLVISDNPDDMVRRPTLSGEDAGWMYGLADRGIYIDTPTVWINEKTADRILAKSGKTVAELRQERESLGEDEIYEFPTNTTVMLNVPGESLAKIPVNHVIGHMPSFTSSQWGTGLDDHMIIVLAQYDCPPMVVGISYPCANQNASGLGVLFETLRTMAETGYQPYKTLLFVAYTGEGWEGGEPVKPPKVKKFLEAKHGFLNNFEIEAVIELRGLGAEGEQQLIISAEGSQRLAKLFQSAARRVGVSSRLTGDAPDLYRIFEPGSAYESGEETPRLFMTWEDWGKTAYMPSDTLLSISIDNLQDAGEIFTLALMILGRETNY